MELRGDGVSLPGGSRRARTLRSGSHDVCLQNPGGGAALADQDSDGDRHAHGPEDFPALLQHVLERIEWETDFFILSNLSMDTLDSCGPQINQGSKAILLGMGQPKRELPRQFQGEVPAGVEEVSAFCPGCLVIGGSSFSEEPGQPERLVQWPDFQSWPLLILTDDPSIARDSSRFLWSVFTRFEPAADVHAARTTVRRHHLCYQAPIMVDARMKPSYPPEVASSPEVVANRRPALEGVLSEV